MSVSHLIEQNIAPGLITRVVTRVCLVSAPFGGNCRNIAPVIMIEVHNAVGHIKLIAFTCP